MSRLLALSRIALMSFFLFNASEALAVGECVTGMYKVANEACTTEQTYWGSCTTRYEQTPESYWCCCDNDYDDGSDYEENPKDDGGCGMRVASAETTAPVATLTALRSVRDNVLFNSPRGREFVQDFYRVSDDIKAVFVIRPALLMEAASLLDLNRPFFAQWGTTGVATISVTRIQQVSDYLGRLSTAAWNKPNLVAVIAKVRQALQDRPFLQSLGLNVVN